MQSKQTGSRFQTPKGHKCVCVCVYVAVCVERSQPSQRRGKIIHMNHSHKGCLWLPIKGTGVMNLLHLCKTPADPLRFEDTVHSNPSINISTNVCQRCFTLVSHQSKHNGLLLSFLQDTNQCFHVIIITLFFTGFTPRYCMHTENSHVFFKDVQQDLESEKVYVLQKVHKWQQTRVNCLQINIFV